MLGQEEKPLSRRRWGGFVAAQPTQEQGQGAEEGQTGTIFFHVWECVLWRVLRLTSGEVFFLPGFFFSWKFFFPPVPDPSTSGAGTDLLVGRAPRLQQPTVPQCVWDPLPLSHSIGL